MAMAVTTPKTDEATYEPGQVVVKTSFNYYSAATEPKKNDLSLLIGGSTETTSVALPVTDLRSLPQPVSSYTHSDHGFQILHQPLPIDGSPSSVQNPRVMTEQYYPAMMALLRDKLGVRATALVNTTQRDVAVVNREKPGTPPFFIAHTDYTAGGSRAHFRAMTTDWSEESQTAEERALFFALRDEAIAAEDAAIEKAGLGPGAGDVLTGKGGHWDWDGTGYEGPRYGIFSVWRPWETVKRDPLAVMSTAYSELEYAAMPRTYASRPGHVQEYYSENAFLRPPKDGAEEKHKWYFLSNQKPEEVLAIKLYDSEALSKEDGSVSLMCPHSAFPIEGTEDAPARRSCEIRVWCIW